MTSSPLSRRKRASFATAAVALVLGGAFVALLLVDLYLHSKYQRTGGVNVWGYKGPVVGRKAPGEFRVAVLGGSTAFGYGVTWDESFPAVLERRLRARTGGVYTVVNLGYNNEGAYSFAFTMEDYAYLDYDMVCLYEGYNDLVGNPGQPNRSVYRRTSPIFRMTGYLPMFPVVFTEKASALFHRGDVGAMYRSRNQVVFRPEAGGRTPAEVRASAADVGRSLERQAEQGSRDPHEAVAVDADGSGCQAPWQDYCHSIAEAVQFSVRNGKRALVVTQPYAVGEYLHARHVQQQSEMAAMLARRFGRDLRVAYANLGDAVDLTDTTLSFDRLHLTAAGNARLAESLVEPVLALASRQTVAGSAAR